MCLAYLCEVACPIGGYVLQVSTDAAECVVPAPKLNDKYRKQ